MKNHCNSIFLLFCLFFNGYAQPCIPIFYPTSVQNVTKAIILKYHQDTILVAGNQVDNQESKVFLLYGDKRGNFYDFKYIPDMNSIEKIFQTQNEDLLIADNLLSLWRVNKQGQVLWKKDNMQIIQDIIENPDGSFVLVGKNNNDIQTYIAKIDSSGNIIQMQSFNLVPSSKIEVVAAMDEPMSSSYFSLSCKSISKCKAGGYLITCDHYTPGFYPFVNVVVLKLDDDFNLVWKSTIHRLFPYYSPVEVYENEEEKIVVFVKDLKLYYDGSPSLYLRYDLDENGELNKITSMGRDGDIFYAADIHPTDDIIISSKRICKLNKQGQLVAMSTVQDSLTPYLSTSDRILEISEEEYVLTGLKDKRLYLVHYPYFGDDCLVRFKGIIYDEQNNNCKRDGFESGIVNYLGYFSLPEGLIYYNSFGEFDYLDGYGYHKYSLPISRKFYTPACNFNENFNVHFEYPNALVDTSFAVNKIDSCFVPYFKMSSSLRRPCEEFIHHCVVNDIKDSLYNSFKVSLEIPEEVSVKNCNYPFTQLGQRLLIELNDVIGQNHIEILFLDSLSCDAVLGEELCFNGAVEGQNPCDSTHLFATDTICYVVKNSFDPNEVIGLVDDFYNCYDKQSDSIIINYTIHFQNTGNDIAKNVYIFDTLDSRWFGLSTLQIDSASHSFEYFVTNGRIRFDFCKINLPDSTNDEPRSKGFVTFHLKALKKSDYPFIYNRAAIFFDFNAPIITNWSIIDECKFPSATIDQKNNCSNFRVRIYDGLIELDSKNNNLNEMILFDAYGHSIVSANGNTMDCSALPTGIYILNIRTETCYKSIKVFLR